MNLPKPQLLLTRALTHSTTRYLLLIGYALVILVILAPVLFASVGADDSYWVLEKGHEAGGSYWTAFWEPASHAFDFSGTQPRTAVLGLAERQVLATFTMQVSVYFSIPPFLVWAAVKIALFLLSIGATVVFLRQLTFRNRQGEIRRIGSSTIAFMATTLPLTIALGVKSQNVGTLNGWNFYPTLTYGPFTYYLLFAALVLRASSLLQRNYRVWFAPVIVVMAFMGFVLNISYELLAVTVPLAGLVILLQPRPDSLSWWMRWRAGITVLAALFVSYTALFVWIRWRISEMACQTTDTCYPGAVVKVDQHALWNNFIGSLPGGNGAYVSEQADQAGRAYPQAGAVSIALALLAAVLMLAMWASWAARRQVVGQGSGKPDQESGDDTRGLLVVLAVSLSIAAGATVITGITARAIDLLETSMLSYRTNVVTWSALSLAAVTVVRLLMISGRRLLGPLALGGLVLVLVVGVALYFPRNVMSAQVNRAGGSVVFIDTLQQEVTMGDTSRAGDARRCDTLNTFLDGRDALSSRIIRAVNGAQASFEDIHHQPFCSAGVPAVVNQARG